MPTRPPSPDPSGTSGDSNPFAGLSAAGLGFFQDWMKAASSALPNLGGTAAGNGAAWAMPTLDPDELDKRIQDLKTVQFWLEQNARMIGMTIQTLEVQRMTLQTLHGMKVPLDALRESMQAKAPTPEPPATPAPATQRQASAASPGQAPDDAPSPDAPTPPPGVNPMQWWSTLTEQFSNLASQAVQAGQDAMAPRPTPADAATKPPKTTSTNHGGHATARPERRANPTGKPRPAKTATARKAPKA